MDVTDLLDFIVNLLDVRADVLQNSMFPVVPLCPSLQLRVGLEGLEGELE